MHRSIGGACARGRPCPHGGSHGRPAQCCHPDRRRCASAGCPRQRAPPVEAVPEACDIKGNVSFNTGERIYHVPGQAYYDETVINEDYGERWFCTEDEAIEAGWRKSLS